MVQFLESERSSVKGHKLLTLAVLPEDGAALPSAVLCWHHGVAEHVGRYRQRALLCGGGCGQGSLTPL